MLDERTLFFTLALLPGLLAVVTLGFRWGFGEDARGLGTWSVGLGSLAAAALSLTVLQSQAIVELQNAFWIGWMTMSAYAVRRFLEPATRGLRWALAGLGVYAGTLLLSDAPDAATARRTLITVYHQACGIAALAGLWRSRIDRRAFGGLLLAVGLLLAMGGSLQRGVNSLLGGPGTGSFHAEAGSLTVSVFLAAVLVAVTLATLGLMLLSADRTRRRFEALATCDGLTGLLNRRGFNERAIGLLAAAARGRHPVAMAVIDLDDFKHINDVHGHEAGDDVLACLGALLQMNARGQDLVARFGGEEFVVLMPMTDADGASRWAERVRQAIEASLRAARRATVTASIGVKSVSDGPDVEDLYRGADAALYRAKSAGKNRVVVA